MVKSDLGRVSALLALSMVVLLPACDSDGGGAAGGAGGSGGAGGAGGAGGVVASEVTVRLIAFNDFHGRLEVDPSADLGGAAYLAQHIRLHEQEQPNTLVVTAGDMIGASEFLSGILHDEPTIAFMNALGVDVAGVGNHEFDRPFAELQRLHDGGCHADGCLLGDSWEGAAFPLLGANVHSDDGTPLLSTHQVIEVEGVRIGFIGATTALTGQIVHQPFVEGMTFEPVATTVNAVVPELQALGVETIVLLLHEGAECEADLLDELDPAIDVVVTGHSHEVYACAGPPLVAQAGEFGQYFTVFDLTIDAASQHLVAGEVNFGGVTHGEGVDPAVEALVASYLPLASAAGAEVVGTISETISDVGDGAAQKPAGLLMADAFLEATVGDAVVAFINGGGVRDSFEYPMSGAETVDGQVTYAEVYAVSPFSNLLLTMSLTGAQLEAALEQDHGNGSPNRLQPSVGFHYSYDPNGSAGDLIDPAEITIQGVPIDLNATYRVTVSSFLGLGGGNIPAFTQGTNLTYGELDRDVVAAYIAAHSPVAAPAPDRVTIK